MNDDMLISYLLSETDENDRRYVEQWIIESQENTRYFEHFRIIWEASRDIASASRIDENAAWLRFNKRIQSQQKNVIPLRNSLHVLLKVAASILVCVALVAVSYFIWDQTNTATVMFATTLKAEKQVLPDGSQVTLNKNSTLSYPRKLRGQQRSVQLKGEAFFDVHPDASRPFVVQVNDVQITVVGTSFNVKAVGQSTEVIVETGAVQVESTAGSKLLKPGDKILVSRNDSTMKELTVTDKLHNYYRTNEFVCDNTPLWKLVEVLNEAYGSKIIISNPRLRDLPLTTTFHNEPLDNILNIISETFDITISRQNDSILLN